jgi:phosphohistidine phosphatase
LTKGGVPREGGAVDLFVIRHGIAVPKGTMRHDPARALTDEGRRELGRVRDGLKALGIRFDNIYTSPWTRALQTSEVLRGLSKKVPEVTRELTREPREKLLRELEGDSVAVVGHEPWLTQLIAWCVTGRVKGAHDYMLEKAGVAHLSGRRKAGRFVLVHLWGPEELSKLRR